MDSPALEDAFDRSFRSASVAEPVTFHPEPWNPVSVVTEAVDGSELRGVFSAVLQYVDPDTGVEVVSRTPNVEIRPADFSERPVAGQEWTIRGARFVSTIREAIGPGWDRHRLQRTSPPSQAA